MQSHLKSKRRDKNGYALMITLGFIAVSLALLASSIRWTSQETNLTARNNIYNVTISAAEAATELVIAQMDRDFIYQNVNSDLSVYENLVPTGIQSNWPVQFEFSDGAGNVNRTRVTSLGAAAVTNLDSEFQGLYGLVMPYNIRSQARPINAAVDLAGAVSQDIQLASIPVFQFAIFYTLDLEINPGPKMVINGKVHSNGTIYAAPVSGLEFKEDVTAVNNIYNDRSPDDPQYGSGKVKPVYDKKHVEKVSALTLPVGSDNSPESVRQILQPPSDSENPNSDIAKQRYYNKADLIVTTTDSGVRVTTGAWDNFSTISPDQTNGTVAGYSFLDTDESFNDLREKKWTTTTQLDVGALKNWIENPKKGSAIDDLAVYRMGHHLDSIYVDDQRSSPSRLTVVRVVNGATLPEDGLTVATQLPLYVKGHFNLNGGDTTPGQTDTSKTKPASLVGDAITILSDNWDDSNAGKSLNKRGAANTTVNAALLGGIVKTTKSGGNKYYSGGVENFPRLLEDWSGKTLTYNGSMVVMFESHAADKFWQNTGNYYNAPTRKWAFDVNFLDQSKLPPCTPQLRKLVRGQWQVVQAK